MTENNPYESPVRAGDEHTKLSLIQTIALWLAVLLGWMFLLIGIVGFVFTVCQYFFGDIPIEVRLQIDAESFRMSVGMTIANLVLGPLLLWTGGRLKKRRWRQAIVGFILAGLWGTFILPALTAGFRW